MKVKTLRCLKDNWTFLLHFPSASATTSSKETVVSIDPGEVTDEMWNELKGRELEAILLTHHHHDHVGGVEALLQKYPSALVFASDRDATRLKFLGRSPHNFSKLGLLNTELPAALRKHSMRILAHPIPGHTEGQVAIEIQEGTSPAHIFVGDTLFAFGCGRCFEGTPDQLFESLQFLKSLPADSLLYFGHDYELRNMEFWRTWQEEAGPELVTQEALATATSGRACARLDFELQRNPFLKIRDVESFRLWRDRRNHF
jgi:hydroxyacylglutathione hydrolase